MKTLLDEILEIPEKAILCYQKNKDLKLPLNVDYIGMGSSYYAPLTLFYSQKEIYPQIASEYYYYLSSKTKPLGVLISQSGESSETVWCLEKFEKVISIVNNPNSTLASSPKTKQVVNIYAGEEKFSSTKTYINTLIVLYLGLGIDPKKGIERLTRKFSSYRQESKKKAELIYQFLSSTPVKGLYIIGSGPNIGTAYEGALTLSETTKLSWIGMPVAQYDHGPKETANESIIIILNGNGKDRKRIDYLKKILNNSSGLTIELEENGLPENLTPLTLILQLNFIMAYLANLMKVGETFQLGNKVTKIDDSLK